MKIGRALGNGCPDFRPFSQFWTRFPPSFFVSKLLLENLNFHAKLFIFQRLNLCSKIKIFLVFNCAKNHDLFLWIIVKNITICVFSNFPAQIEICPIFEFSRQKTEVWNSLWRKEYFWTSCRSIVRLVFDVACVRCPPLSNFLVS